MELKVIEIPETYQDIYVVGDIHGEFRELVFNISERYKLHDAVVIVAGDCGIGFELPQYYEDTYNRISEKLEKHNICIYGIRGNHDDPLFFNGSLKIDFPRFKTLADYTVLKKGDREVLCVGGAVSIDQEWRLKENQALASKGSTKRVWWPSEEPQYLGNHDLESLPGRYYCIVSHEAPLSCLPVLTRTEEIPEPLYQRVLKSRRFLEDLLWQCKPYRWYYGHHHESHSESNGITQSRCLAIQELIRIPLEEEYGIKENPEGKQEEED